MFINFNPNRKIDCILDSFKEISNERIESITTVALSLLSLNQQTAAISSIGVGAYQSYVHLTFIIADIRKGNWSACGERSIRLSLIITSAALAVISPSVQFALSNGVCMAWRVGKLSLHLWKHEWKESGFVVLQITHQAIHIASVVYATPEWLALSLLTQLGCEVYQQLQAAKKGHIPEALAYLVLAAIRANKLKTQVETLHRNYLGPRLTQDQWEKIYDDRVEELVSEKKPCHLESLLIERGFSSHIEGISFDGDKLMNCILRNLYFKDCDFSYAKFNGSIIQYVFAEDCNFYKSIWIDTVVRNSFFSKCDFTAVEFFKSRMKEVTFSDCDMTRADFNSAFLQGIWFVQSKLLETSFLATTVDRGMLKDCDLTDSLLLDAKDHFIIHGGSPHQITRPVIAIGWDFRDRGAYASLSYKALRKEGAIPLRYDYKMKDINAELLNSEVHLGIMNCQGKPKLSIPIEVLHQAKEGSEIYKIQLKAHAILRHCDGLAIPGGPDVEPEFYGAMREYDTDTCTSKRRSMLEFALLDYAHIHKIPTLGTCRGSQMINVFFGGTLVQHVNGQNAYSEMEFADSPHGEWLLNLAMNRLLALSMHHQASKDIGEGLHVILKSGNIPKFLVSEDGNFFASQIHPEVYVKSENESRYFTSYLSPDDMMKNREIYRYFIGKTEQRRQRNLARDHLALEMLLL